jgi:O-antigen/teichoic acid export membrane protein
MRDLRQKIAISVISQVVGQILMGLFGVVALRVMTNSLGLRGYGVYATIYAFVTTFSILTELGVNSIGIREIAKSPDNAQEIISHNLGLRMTLSVFAIPVIFLIGILLYPHASSDLRFGILLLSVYLIFDAASSTASAYFSAKVRNEIPATLAVIRQIVFMVIVIGVAFLGWGLYGFLLAFIVSTAISASLTLWIMHKTLSAAPKFKLRIWRNFMKMSISVGVLTIIGTIYLKADSILLSVMKGTTAVGIYNVAYSLINVFIYFSGFLMGALIPSIATASAHELKNIIQKAFHVMGVFAFLVLVGGVVVRKDAVILVSNVHFAEASMPFAILALATVFSYFFTIFSFASTALNKHHKMIYISVTTLFLNIGINLLVIPKFGLIGAAWATVLSEFVAVVLGYRLFHIQTGIKIDFKVLLRPFLASLATYIIASALHTYLHTSSALLNCILALLYIGIPYFLILNWLHGMPEEINDLIHKSFSGISSPSNNH